MIDRQIAIDNSVKYAESTYNELDRLNLEEIEISDDEKFWLITLGWDVPKKTSKFLLASTDPSTIPLGRPIERVYKTFYVDSKNGDVKKMKIWKGYDEY